MGLFSFLKGKPKVDLAELFRGGAKLVDVRSKAEYASGHAKGTMNVPLEQIASKAFSWKKDEPIILCCRSGMRSGVAVSQLKRSLIQQK